MPQSSARRVALIALRSWRIEHRRADSVTAGLLNQQTTHPSDRAFALELFYGVLRNMTLLDFWIGCLRSSPVEADLRDILRLGLYQLLVLDIAEHAAVYESVALAPAKGRGLINAVLRAAARKRESLRSQADSQPLAIRTSHPQFLIDRWEKNFGAEFCAELCRWNNQPPPVYARINRLKSSDTEFATKYPDARPLSDRADFFEVSTFPDDALARGECYIQDPSTIVACEMVAANPGEKILDACAAPGGKTSFLAQQMENRGAILACDRQRTRVQILSENLDRLGVKIAQVLSHDWSKGPVPKEIAAAAPFDRILVDAPCTNTGVMRRRVDAKWRLRPADFLRMQKEQLDIVRAVFPLMKPGGVLVYSTCSLEPEENEQIVERVLLEFPALSLVESKISHPVRDHFDGAFAARLVAAN